MSTTRTAHPFCLVHIEWQKKVTGKQFKYESADSGRKKGAKSPCLICLSGQEKRNDDRKKALQKQSENLREEN